MNFQSVSTGQKLPTSRTEGDLSGTAAGGYLANGFTPGPVLRNALKFVDESLERMVTALQRRGLLDHTAIIVWAKHGQSPMNIAALNRIKDRTIIDALNHAWNTAHQGGKPTATPLVAFGIDDDGMLLWLNDNPAASVDGKPVPQFDVQRSMFGVRCLLLLFDHDHEHEHE
jgi:predicted AlkP superfamily pyrophosphatase or phosphodiesterase